MHLIRSIDKFSFIRASWNLIIKFVTEQPNIETWTMKILIVKLPAHIDEAHRSAFVPSSSEVTFHRRRQLIPALRPAHR